jgi:hypothetical protein
MANGYKMDNRDKTAFFLLKISKHLPKKGTKHMHDLGQKRAEMQMWTWDMLMDGQQPPEQANNFWGC